MNGIVATAEIDIEAPVERVWSALVDPDQIEKYMFGSRVETDWQVGSPIVWAGDYDGKPYQDKGEVLAVDEPTRLSVTHFSPLSGQDDVPESYHTLVYSLSEQQGRTHLELSQDNNGSEEEAEHSRGMWAQMLQGVKEHVEGG
jgi:uncharacterized protein YndB with AHSA1/START domain